VGPCATDTILSLAEVKDEAADESTETATDDKPSTSKDVSDKTSKSLKSDSDSETQHTSCSDDSADEKVKGPLEDLKLLDSILNELLAIVDKKA
jgi:hypothetical protein